MFERAFTLHTTRDGSLIGLGAVWEDGVLYQVDLVPSSVTDHPETFWLNLLPEAIQACDEASVALAAPLWADLAERLEGHDGRAWVLAERGTPFQQQVRAALQRIPRGEVRTYKQLAEHLGMPTAFRAVAGGCSSNPFALLVPCHRVVGGQGKLGGYRWGTALKRQLLSAEGAGG